jgi:Flp pilus assembly protein TadB
VVVDLEPLRGRLDRAGWTLPAERCLAAVAANVVLCWGAALYLARDLGPAGAVAVALVSGVAPVAAFTLALESGARSRSRLAQLELASILELLGLELSAGGSAQAALSGVLAQTSGTLASQLGQLLIASQLAPNAPLDVGVERLATRLELPALRSLAAILAMSRQYGCGVGDGVRALAADLRRAQRRELIARSRRALNRVLVPAAVGVLLPFMAILMFPAVSTLFRSYA